ncbi:hypothetical protein ACJMK2_034614 [Sinanodonta woodiana]|uniref:Uncharacterized protein n=1 Tax=Sinanodonta woodiana TaxID=1069815 RepID=A0ABD3WTX5_SINWO
MASGKLVVSVLIAVQFFSEICCSVAFPVEDYAKRSDTEPEVKFFECHAMACLIGTQFCDRFWKRCDDCFLYEKDCFTSRQQQNCTVFCQEMWFSKQREILKNEKYKTGEGQQAALPWIVTTAVLAIILLACGCVFFREKIRTSVRWFGKELHNYCGKYDVEDNRGSKTPETVTFLAQHEILTPEQHPTGNIKPTIEATGPRTQHHDAYQTLDPNSLYSKDPFFPMPETSEE